MRITSKRASGFLAFAATASWMISALGVPPRGILGDSALSRVRGNTINQKAFDLLTECAALTWKGQNVIIVCTTAQNGLQCVSCQDNVLLHPPYVPDSHGSAILLGKIGHADTCVNMNQLIGICQGIICAGNPGEVACIGQPTAYPKE